MLSVVLALSLLTVATGEGQHAQPTSLVAENGREFSFRDGVLEIRSGRGWLRTARLFLDFKVTFEFKAATKRSNAGVVIRTWTGVGEWPDAGYRIVLPTDSASDPATVLVGHHRPVTTIERGRIVLKSADEWQQVEVSGERQRITILMNGTLVGAFEVGVFGGHIMFDNKAGRVQLRNISIVSTERPPDIASEVMTHKQLEAAGGDAPKLIQETRPHYTPEAMERKVEGRVDLEAVVLPDGSTGPIRVTGSLDPDLDLSAVAAIRAWRFEPAMLNGKTVPSMVEVEMTFRLK
jgi:TonB family protein